MTDKPYIEHYIERQWIATCAFRHIPMEYGVMGVVDDILMNIKYDGSPMDKIHHINPYSNEFYELLVVNNIKFRKALQETLMISNILLRGKLRSCSVGQLSAIPGISPKQARVFIHISRPVDDPDRKNTVIFSDSQLKLMRHMGYHVPARLDEISYRVVEAMYLDHMRRTLDE